MLAEVALDTAVVAGDDEAAAWVCVVDVVEVEVVDVDVEVEVWVVVCALVLDVLELMVVTLTPGHSACMPIPFWKTPMMLVSPTSTLPQFWSTSSVTLTNPWMQDELQRVPELKSEAWQP